MVFMYIIYLITNKINNKKYIGFTSKGQSKRWSKHILSSNNPKTKLHRAIKKYKPSSFSIETIECSIDRDYLLHEREPYWIDYFNTVDDGYNMTYGGDGCHGYKHNHKTLSIISENSSRNWKNKHFREKQKSNKRRNGQSDSNSTIIKRVISRFNNGNYIMKESTKNKISSKNTGYVPPNTKLWKITNPDGIDIYTFSMKSYCDIVSIDHRLLHKVSQGKNSHHKGYTAIHIDNPKIHILPVSKYLPQKDIPKDGIVIYNPEFQYKQDILLSICKSRNGIYDRTIYARKTFIKLVDSKDARLFYDNNHIQGYKGGGINYGLFLDNEMVSCMSFTRSRFNTNCDWELSRFSSLINHLVIGGASKLFKRFLNDHFKDGMKVVSYADLRFFDGGMYEKLGFKLDGKQPPNYYYIHKKDPKTILRKENFRHRNLKDKLTIYDPDLSEYENMKLNGYHRIYDRGKKRFIYQ